MSAESSVYRQPGFLPFLAARVLAMFAVQIMAVVVAWQVYELTRDPMSLAYVGLAQFLPMLFLLLPAGDLIDRYDRKWILGLSWAVEAVCAGVLLWLSLAHGPVEAFYGVLVAYGCARAFTGPALSSLLLRPAHVEDSPLRLFYKGFNFCFSRTTNGYLRTVGRLARRAACASRVSLSCHRYLSKWNNPGL